MSEQFEEYISDCLTAWIKFKKTRKYQVYRTACISAWNKYYKYIPAWEMLKT